MNGFNGKAQRLSDDDFLIEAQAPIEGEGFRPVIFRSSRIDYVFGFNDDISGLRLNDGVTIPVALPLADLRKKIYMPDFRDMPVLDLTAVTGEMVGEVERIRLSKNFNPVVQAQETAEEKPLAIITHVHEKREDRHFKRVEFSDTSIRFYEPHVDRPEKEIWVTLKEGHRAGGFENFYIPMPLSTFLWHLDHAKKEGRKKLDLSEMTRPKTSTNFKLG